VTGNSLSTWVTDFTLTKENAYILMRGSRERWKIENWRKIFSRSFCNAYDAGLSCRI